MATSINEYDTVFQAWVATCAWMGTPAPPVAAEIFQPVLESYRQPHRHYHNLRHIAQCLAEMAAVRLDLDDKVAVHAAILFHDCVYDPARGDNEERSADVAEAVIRRGKWPQASIDNVRRLILATKHEGRAESRDAAIVVDVDLSILGKPRGNFDEYERAIRREYEHVPDADFAAGRARVLRSFLDRPTIYQSPPFRALYEKQARENLQRSLARLERGDLPT